MDALKRDSGFDPSRTVVSILVDHSGSLRGQRAVVACVLTEVMADILSRVGVRYEILGFTTAEWKGGKSRKRWLQMGRPPKPGRLCDLLHIVYRAASETIPGAPYSIRHLLRNDLLKENVDGEALFWASERLKSLDADHNVIVVISDGVPVDDSTLNENSPDILFDHLKDIIGDLRETPGFGVAGIGIDHQLDRLYPNSLTIETLEQVSSELPSFLSSLLRR